MASMLRVAKNGCMRTHLMYQANLGFYQLNTFLSVMMKNGLIEESFDEENNRKMYYTTPKGMDFLGKFSELEQVLTLQKTGEG